MEIDFRGIRTRLQAQLQLLRWRLLDAQVKLLKRGIEIVGNPALTADSKAELDELGSKANEQNKWALYTSVGQALSAWAAMEQTLVAIAALLLRTSVPKAGIMMYSILNFQVWLNVIGDLFSQDEIYATLKPKWNKIYEKLRAMKDTRDRLAHHTVWHEDKIDPALGSHTLLRPPEFDTRQKSQKQKYEPLDYDQILRFVDSVHKVQDEITTLINSITEKTREALPSPQKSSEQGAGQNPA
jgi:hypothetical protein